MRLLALAGLLLAAPPARPASAPEPPTAGIASPPASAPPAASPALADKLAQGDAAFGAGDYRGALFAYQDAVYLEPTNAAARVKLGRAYLALRYPDQAQAQAEQALAADPSSEDARRLLEEARNAPAHPGLPPRAAPAGASATAAAAAPSPVPAAPRPPPRSYKLPAEAAGGSGPTPLAAPVQVVAAAPAAAPPAPPPPPPAPGPAAAQHYRNALDLIARREYAAAVVELNDAVAQEPKLGVAYAARASAHFGLGRYKEAAADYTAAMSLEPSLATPVYGLAEAYRLLGDPRAADLYRRYAQSQASDVREDLRAVAARRAEELSAR
ncbi:MAG TPA: tetratricopeptide repeat protein [Anaeromyxobacter sp.]|nr:tetratricopeptide repeat protein [Anaeromyxobacter sp.]